MFVCSEVVLDKVQHHAKQMQSGVASVDAVVPVWIGEEVKILARKHLGKKKAIEISVPYRERVGEAEIHTWGDGWKNLRFLYAKRIGLARKRTEWGPLEDNPDSLNNDLPEQKK